MLKFSGGWRFDNPGRIADGVSAEFSRLIGKVASQGDSRLSILEHFKAYFASAAGTTSSRSSSESWARRIGGLHERRGGERTDVHRSIPRRL